MMDRDQRGDSRTFSAGRQRRIAAACRAGAWLFLTNLALTAPALAAQAPAAAAPARVNLTYARSLELVRQNSPDLKQAQLDYEYATLTYKRAQGESNTKIALLQAEAAFRQAEQQWADAQDQAVIAAMNAYFTALNAVNQLQIAQEAVRQAESQLRIVQTKLQQGLAAKGDLLSAEQDALAAAASLQGAENAQTLSQLSLARILGLSLDTPMQLEPADLKVQPFDLSEADALQQAQANEAALRGPRTALQIAELQLQAADIESTPEVTKKMLTNRRQKAAVAFEQAQLQLRIDARQRYRDVKQKQGQIPAAAKGVETAEEAYRVAKLRVDSGLDVPQALSRAGATLTRARQAHVDAISQYTVARLNFLRWLGAQA